MAAYNYQKVETQADVRVVLPVKQTGSPSDQSYFTTNKTNIHWSAIQGIHDNDIVFTTRERASDGILNALNGVPLPKVAETVIKQISANNLALTNGHLSHLPESFDLIKEFEKDVSKRNEVIREVIMRYLRPIGVVVGDGISRRVPASNSIINTVRAQQSLTIYIAGVITTNVMTTQSLQIGQRVEAVVPVETEWANDKSWAANDVDHPFGRICFFFRPINPMLPQKRMGDACYYYNTFNNSLWHQVFAKDIVAKYAPPEVSIGAMFSKLVSSISMLSIQKAVSSGMFKLFRPTSNPIMYAGRHVNRKRDIKYGNENQYTADAQNGSMRPEKFTTSVLPRAFNFSDLFHNLPMGSDLFVNSLNVFAILGNAIDISMASNMNSRGSDLFADRQTSFPKLGKMCAMNFFRDVQMSLLGHSEMVVKHEHLSILHRLGTRRNNNVLENAAYMPTSNSREVMLNQDRGLAQVGNVYYEALPEFLEWIWQFLVQLGAGYGLVVTRDPINGECEVYGRT